MEGIIVTNNRTTKLCLEMLIGGKWEFRGANGPYILSYPQTTSSPLRWSLISERWTMRIKCANGTCPNDLSCQTIENNLYNNRQPAMVKLIAEIHSYKNESPRIYNKPRFINR